MQPRAPCFHINYRFNTRDPKFLLSREVENRCCAGWLYKVLEEVRVTSHERHD